MIDLRVADDVRLLAVDHGCKAVSAGWTAPRLFPVLSIREIKSFEQGLETLIRLITGSGKGHSCGIFTQNKDRAEQVAKSIPVGRVMANQSTGMGNTTGSVSNNMPFTMTLGCGTWGGGLTTDNVGWRSLINITTLSYPTERQMVDPRKIFADLDDF